MQFLGLSNNEMESNVFVLCYDTSNSIWIAFGNMLEHIKCFEFEVKEKIKTLMIIN